MNAPKRRNRRALGLLVALLIGLVGLPACGLVSDDPGSFTLTADFARGTGLYPGSPVRVLGIDVGRITKVSNHRGSVRVRMRLDDDVRLPADVRATIVPLTLLGERYVQLGPAYTTGPRLRSGSTIPQSRTAVPTEFDELLRGLQDYIGSIDPKRAGNVVTDLAEVLQGKGSDLNDLIDNASQTLGLLAGEGDEIHDIVRSLGDLSRTLRGRTDEIESVIRNYDLVAEVLIENKDDLDATIKEFDRAARELTAFIVQHQDPLHEDVAVLTQAGQTVSRNTDNLKSTLHSTVRLFEAAGRAYDKRSNALDVNNQTAPDLTSALISGRLRDRIAGLCRRLQIPACSDPASPLLNQLASTLPDVIRAMQSGQPPSSGAPKPPSKAPAAAPPTGPKRRIPSQSELITALASQLTDGLSSDQAELVKALDSKRLVALLGLDPALLQVIPDLNAEQFDRLRQADPADLGQVLLDLTNEIHPPASRLDPILPGGDTTPTTPPKPTIPDPVVQVLGNMLGGG